MRRLKTVRLLSYVSSHCVPQEFNRGIFDYLIATDASVDYGEVNEREVGEDEVSDAEDEVVEDRVEDVGGEDEDGEDIDEKDSSSESGVETDDEGGSESSDEPAIEAEMENSNDLPRDSKGKMGPDAAFSQRRKNNNAPVPKNEYSVSRGIDFQNVTFVINFDFPVTTASYKHRIGRTARCGASGTALSFVSMVNSKANTSSSSRFVKEQNIAERDASALLEVQQSQPQIFDSSSAASASPSTESSSLVDDSIAASQTQSVGMISQPSPLLFNTMELETFRYRVYDVMRSVTNASVKELRSAEIKKEILNSNKLQSYFAENPNDLKVNDAVCSIMALCELKFLLIALA